MPVYRLGLKHLAWVLVALAGLVLDPRSASAAASDWAAEEQVKVRLISAGQAAASESVRLGLEFDLAPGWKIYWRSPGDAGLPPVVDWAGSQNLATGEIGWPVPHRFSLFGLETFGYGDRVVLPIEARLERPGEPLFLVAAVDYLVCEEICIPYSANLSLDLPSGPESRATEAFLIESFARQVPGQGAERGLSLESAALGGSMEAPVLEVTARSDTPFTAPDLLVEGPPGFAFAKPKVTLSDDGLVARMSVATSTHLDQVVLEGKQLTLTVTDGLRGLEQQSIARFAAMPSKTTPAVDPLALLGILGLAVLGGLILNLMPCVLPVLSIKLLSIVEQGGRERRDIRASFLASVAGILFSFLVLATVAVALKTGGMAVGWGIQFQQPLFLSAMALVMTLFAYNLMGFFEVPLPAFLGRLGARGPDKGLWGNFGTGALATLLATPCSAPFLGTSVGFALSRGALEIYLIFTALGIGLALPYLLVAAVPRLAAWLPRPGNWMITLRRILGLLLAGTAIWLLTVLAAQVGLLAALLAGALLLGLGLVLWAGPNLMKKHRLATPAAASLLALAALTLPSGLPLPSGLTLPGGDKTVAVESAWRDLDEPAIADLVRAGQVVFVDITADWCITCQVNKKLVLDTAEVAGQLAAAGVVQMRGDWTLPSDEISAYLARFQRYGIPFNAVYGPGAPQGLPLPELLTVDAVTAAIEAASGPARAATAPPEGADSGT